MRRPRVFSRVLVAVLALLAASAALSGAVAAWSMARAMEAQYRSKGTAIAETIASASVDGLLEDRPLDGLQAMVDQYAETEGVAYILVCDRNGEALAHTFAPEVPPELRHPPPESARTTAGPLRLGGRDYLDVAAPILDGQVGHVHVGMDQSAIDAAFWATARRQASAATLLALAGVAGAYVLVRWVTRPLERLTRHARKVAALDSLFAPTAPVAAELAPIAGRRDEVGQLARAMVHMLEAIATREQHLKWAEGSLRRSEQYYRSLIENVGDVIVLLDPEGRARYVSPSLRPFLDFAPEEWVGRDVSLLVHPDDREAFRRAVSDCLPLAGPEDEPQGAGPGEGASVEVRMVRADGALRVVDASLTNLLLDPAVGGIVVTLRDVSDRKRTLELTQAREAAEEASRLKSQFLANMSHEFFTPMHQLIGLMQVMMMEDLGAELRETLQTMWGSATALHEVLKNILDFSKLEGGELRLEVGPVRPREVVGDVAAMLGPRAEAKGLRLEVAVADEVPELITADRDRLRQVLLHLAGNAIKFTERGGVAVRALVERPGPGDDTVDWVPEEADRVAVRFEVSDTGPGITPEQQARIFEPFVQGDGELTRRHGGTGLGLAIARSLVGLMGGRLRLRSEPGRGSAFGFTLRVRAPAGDGPRPLGTAGEGA
jgi:PAS domain S-box-containing protein